MRIRLRRAAILLLPMAAAYRSAGLRFVSFWFTESISPNGIHPADRDREPGFLLQVELLAQIFESMGLRVRVSIHLIQDSFVNFVDNDKVKPRISNNDELTQHGTQPQGDTTRCIPLIQINSMR